MNQLTPEQLEKRKKLNKKILIFFSIPIAIILIIVAFAPKDSKNSSTAGVSDPSPSAVEGMYNRAPIYMNLSGCTVEKAIALSKEWAQSWHVTPSVVHDSVVTFISSSQGHNNKMQSYTQKVTACKIKDGVKITCSCDWDDDYAATVNENTLNMIKLHFANPSLKYN